MKDKRTYGKWWQECPSTPKPFKCTDSSFISQDFVDVKFRDPVFPTRVEIFETYNPGAVVRILARKYEEKKDILCPRWFVLWSGEVQQCAPEARIFSPLIRKCPFKTRQLRLEFNQAHLEYYTELDAVLLYGLESKHEYASEISCAEDVTVKNLADSYSKHMILNSCHQGADPNGKEISCHILDLPIEIINKVFSFLTIPDLGSVAKTCKYFRDYSYDLHWFKEFDLQPYWSKVNDSDLQLLGKRFSSMEKVKLSWCGCDGLISSVGFSRFIQKFGGRLRCLYLSCCRFLSQNSLTMIKTACPDLEEIDLSSCVEIPSESFQELSNLKCLKRLNVYRTQITQEAFEKIARSCTKLMYINLGGCIHIKNYDEVVKSLKFCLNVTSLDLWRAKTLSPIGVVSIAEHCPNLEEIDIGWCFSAPSDGSIRHLASRCPKLKKLFLTAVRSVCDDDLVAISENCLFMEQLDILGTSLVSKTCVERVLGKCKHLKFFDLSFCSKLDDEWFRTVRGRFPNVALKKSVN